VVVMVVIVAVPLQLCDMEMPLVDNGNMKRFHKAYISHFPCLLMFKEKYGHL